MAGGTFITQNKVRPGFYYRFEATNEKLLFADTGVVALPLVLNWGAEGEIFSINTDASTSRFMRTFGYPRASVLLVNEALKRGLKLLAYRVNTGGDKAELDLTADIPVKVHAKYTGTRGNDVAVQIALSPKLDGTYTVSTFVNGITYDEQIGIRNVSDIRNNDWVDFENTDPAADDITAAAGGDLSGGSDGAATLDDYNKFLRALELEDFNAFGLPVDDEPLKTLFAEAVNRYTDELGKMVQLVLCNYIGVGNERISSIQNGVVLEDGTIVNKAQAVAWFAGASASAYPATSLTYTAYDGAIEPDEKLPNDTIEDMLRAGQIVFTAQKDPNGNKIAVVEQDKNTLIRYTEDRPQPWGKNAVVRAMYYLTASLGRTWHLYFIGKVKNNFAGRVLFKSYVGTIMDKLVAQDAFENFELKKDVIVKKGVESDAVICEIAVQPVDAMEKMYCTIVVDIAAQNAAARAEGEE